MCQLYGEIKKELMFGVKRKNGKQTYVSMINIKKSFC